MSRSIVLSNGSLCVALDDRGLVRDIYYPHVGLENHVRGNYLHRVGVWVDGTLFWLSDSGWHIDIHCEADALVSSITARHEQSGIQLMFSDTVTQGRNIFFRRVRVKNLADRPRELKLYFGHQFELHKMHGSDTAYFDPRARAMIHYKGQRVFLISAHLAGEPFNDFATGRSHVHGLEGSHRDAEDGELSKNPIEHGPADSIIGVYAQYGAGEERVCEYWVIAGFSIPEVLKEHAYIQKGGPARLLSSSVSSWRKWLRPLLPNFADLDDTHQALFKHSLMYAKAHQDVDGGIVASVDSDMFQHGLDTYSYVWMRDGAYVALALDEAGDYRSAHQFFAFCAQTISDEGYFMHKYSPDGSLGSSWHPWMAHGRFQLPIQEDETAIVVCALAECMRRRVDITFLEEVYEPLVHRTAHFLMSYMHPDTGLPEPSYDLWERKRGVSTYTSAAVCGALAGASELASLMKKEKEAAKYGRASEALREVILTQLWRNDVGMFYNMLKEGGGFDPTVDISSVYGVFRFGVLPADDSRLTRAFESTVRRLSEGVVVGGIGRFENDDYYRASGVSASNPWFLTTLWYAEFLTARATTRADLTRVRDILTWTVHHALPSGVLSEQLNSQTGEQTCTGPLAWSHAAYISAVLTYCARYRTLSARR